jgi:hypothetical protein
MPVAHLWRSRGRTPRHSATWRLRGHVSSPNPTLGPRHWLSTRQRTYGISPARFGIITGMDERQPEVSPEEFIEGMRRHDRWLKLDPDDCEAARADWSSRRIILALDQVFLESAILAVPTFRDLSLLSLISRMQTSRGRFWMTFRSVPLTHRP